MNNYEMHVNVEDLNNLSSFGFEKRNNSYFYTSKNNPKTGEPYKSVKKNYPELEVTEEGKLLFHVGSRMTTKYFTEILAKLKNANVLQPGYNVVKGDYVW